MCSCLYASPHPCLHAFIPVYLAAVIPACMQAFLSICLPSLLPDCIHFSQSVCKALKVTAGLRCAVRGVVAVLQTEFMQSCRLEAVASMPWAMCQEASWAIAAQLAGRCGRTGPSAGRVNLAGLAVSLARQAGRRTGWRDGPGVI